MRFFALFRPIWTAIIFVLATLITPMGVQAQTNHAFTVTLNGDWYLQTGDVLNQSDPGISVVGLEYGIGPFREGGAIFQRFTGNATELQPLPGYSDYYGVNQWGFSPVASGDRFYFSGLDLDTLLTGLVPDGTLIDTTGGTMRDAYVEVLFSDGFYKRLSLSNTAWMQTQILQFTEQVSPVPEPHEATMLILGLAMLGAHRRRQKR